VLAPGESVEKVENIALARIFYPAGNTVHGDQQGLK
jgi:hypothetical protein